MERRATADFEGSYQSASRQGNSACRRCQSLRADGELLERPYALALVTPGHTRPARSLRRHASVQVGAAVAPTIEAASALFGPQKMIRLARLKRNAFS